MKSAITFVLIFLCSLLSGPGYSAPLHQANLSSYSQEIFQQCQDFSFTATTDHPIIAACTSTDETDYFSFTEDDDQDENNQQVSSGRTFTPFCNFLISPDQYDLRSPLFAISKNEHAQTTRIFILQRALRI